jgi:hypothetical protein
MLLLDTDVMIDIMRGYSPAVAWLRSLGSEVIALPGLVAMELVQGCRNRQEQQQVEATLRQYTMYWPTQSDCARAFEDLSLYHLGHGIGILDSLIAETAVGIDVKLVTFNEKHYRVVEDLQTEQPYLRTST